MWDGRFTAHCGKTSWNKLRGAVSVNGDYESMVISTFFFGPLGYFDLQDGWRKILAYQNTKCQYIEQRIPRDHGKKEKASSS